MFTDKNIIYRKDYELYQTSLQPLSNHFDSWAIYIPAFYLFVNSTVLKQILGKLCRPGLINIEIDIEIVYSLCNRHMSSPYAIIN